MTAGVNIVGFVEGEHGQGKTVRLGLGEIVRRLSRGLEYAGIPFVTLPYRPSSGEDAPPLPERAVYDTNVICLNADYLGDFLADVGSRFFVGRTSVGFWFWETSTFRAPPRMPLACLDEVWVASSYVRDAVSRAVDLPVLVAPLPMDVPEAPSRSRSELGLPDGFLFLFVFNFVSGMRKNPTAVVDAFTRAFAPGEGPVLVLKSVNGRERKPALLAELERAAEGRSDIVIRDGYMAEEESRAMIASCDCYVSLHRSEGLGLTMAEAMAYGKPVIATGYSGNLEFMDERSGFLVPYREAPVSPEWWAYAPGASWAEPDVDAASERMREVWENAADARLRAARARDALLGRFSLERTADFLTTRLAELRVRGALETRTPRDATRAAILEASERLLAETGESLGQDSATRLGARARRTLRRALWPYLREQRALDTALLHTLVALQRSVESLELRLERLERAPQQHRSADGPRG